MITLRLSRDPALGWTQIELDPAYEFAPVEAYVQAQLQTKQDLTLLQRDGTSQPIPTHDICVAQLVCR